MRNTLQDIISFFPPDTHGYCKALILENTFSFKITKSRATKLGDFRKHLSKVTYTITVNGDLNQYAFLITFLHELAHLKTDLKYDIRKVKPHGAEWQDEFRKLLMPLVQLKMIPEQLIEPIQKYASKPSASSGSSRFLMEALNAFDHPNDYIYLNELTIEDSFFLKDRRFQILEKIRTRFLCLDIDSKKKYLVSGNAQVIQIS